MNLLELTGIPILEQLQMEEALLRTDDQNWCLINRGSPPAIVMGISGKPDQLVHLDRLHIPLIKRFSGGGTVVVDPDTLFVTLIGSADLLDGPCFPEQILRWSSQFYPLDLRENDYTLGDLKVGGNAQYIRRGRFLHHTSFLWDYCPKLMGLLKHPQRQPVYRQGRGHLEFITRLRDRFPSQEAFLSTLHAKLEMVPCSVPTLSTTHRTSTSIMRFPTPG